MCNGSHCVAYTHYQTQQGVISGKYVLHWWWNAEQKYSGDSKHVFSISVPVSAEFSSLRGENSTQTNIGGISFDFITTHLANNRLKMAATANYWQFLATRNLNFQKYWFIYKLKSLAGLADKLTFTWPNQGFMTSIPCYYMCQDVVNSSSCPNRNHNWALEDESSAC